MSETKTKGSPIGKIFGNLTKQYVGVLSAYLKHLEIERYWYIILRISEYSKPISQNELANDLGHDKTMMVRIINYLVSKGYVDRKQNPSDRRQYFILLTGKAKKVVPEIRKAFEEINKAALTGIAPASLKNFYTCLHIIEENLKRMPSNKVNLDFKKSKSIHS